ncbi:MAG: DUF2442 domain-containing protein [Bacteriovoracaceae bacterium]|nr:DUF2442 domain-containing protein [Bacteriovoracaceae bacterium]
MNSLAQKVNEVWATNISFTADMIILELSDGREIKAPLTFYPRLLNATEKQRSNYRIIGGGEGIHWPEIDEDLSVESIVLGRKANI